MSKKDIDKFQRLEEVYLMMKIGLFKYAYSIVRNETDAEDALQSSMANVIGAVDRIRDFSEPALRCYLKKTVYNECINLVRARRNRADIDEDLIADEKNDVANFVLKRLEYEEAIEIIRNLKPKHVLYINMKYFQDLSDEQIAKALQIKVDSLRMLASRARAELIKEINRRSGEE